MKVLGIDPGYGRLGVAVVEGDKTTHTLLHSSCVETDAKNSFVERLHIGVTEVTALIKKFSPDIVALETLFFSTNQKTVMHVAEMRGALLFAAHDAGCVVQEFAPQQVKSAVAGSGRGGKSDVAAMLPHLIHLPSKKMLDDEYDAIAVAITCLVSQKNLKTS